jgi:hypothetical protein
MEPDPPGGGLLEGEGEAVEHLVGAEPEVGVSFDVDARTEVVGVLCPEPAVRSVGGHDQVGTATSEVGTGEVGTGEVGTGKVGDLPAVLDVDVEVQCPLGEDVQQHRAAQTEAVSGQVRRLRTAQGHFLQLPPDGGGPHLPGALPIVAEQQVQQVVPVHDPPAVGGPRRVALDDRDVVTGVAQLRRDGEVQTRRSATDTDDPHDGATPFVDGCAPVPRSAGGWCRR